VARLWHCARGPAPRPNGAPHSTKLSREVKFQLKNGWAPPRPVRKVTVLSIPSSRIKWVGLEKEDRREGDEMERRKGR